MSESKGCEADWRVATDPKTGREYYYNKSTKETTWTKVCDFYWVSLIVLIILQPLALASDEEKEERERQRLETRKFFDEMERNILKKYDPNYIDEKDDRDSFDFDEALDSMWEREPGMDTGMLKRRQSIGGIRLVRTISTIDGMSFTCSKPCVQASI